MNLKETMTGMGILKATCGVQKFNMTFSTEVKHYSHTSSSPYRGKSVTIYHLIETYLDKFCLRRILVW